MRSVEALLQGLRSVVAVAAGLGFVGGGAQVGAQRAIDREADARVAALDDRERIGSEIGEAAVVELRGS